MTPEEKANLLLAIDRAEGPGECKYVVDGKPHCVAAQLCAIEGVSVEDLEAAGPTKIWSVDVQSIKSVVKKYPLVEDLQSSWDHGPSCTLEEARNRLRDMVNR